MLFPTTEHAPFDLVAYDDGVFYRVQVKYRSARSGAVTVQFRGIWADRHGTHIRSMDKQAVDVVCVYCPDTDDCYYVRPSAHGASVTLRLAPSRNGQVTGLVPATACRSLAEVVASVALDERSGG